MKLLQKNKNFELVKNLDAVRLNIEVFNRDAKLFYPRASKLLRQSRYWVYDETLASFGPSKFIAFEFVDFQWYETAIAKARTGEVNKAIFGGYRCEKQIEKEVLRGSFGKSEELTTKLIIWGEELLGEGSFDKINRKKWRFIKIAK